MLRARLVLASARREKRKKKIIITPVLQASLAERNISEMLTILLDYMVCATGTITSHGLIALNFEQDDKQ